MHFATGIKVDLIVRKSIAARIAAHYASLTPVQRMYGAELPEAALLAHARHPAGD